MATVLITGGTGLIGRALAFQLIERGYRVVVLTRKPSREIAPFGTGEPLSYAIWNVETGQFPLELLSQIDHIVHLAGANVGKGRWTAGRKKEIARSRIESGSLLVKALKDHPNQVKAVIGASAIGWYGADTGKPFIETDPAADDFLGGTCRAWEESMSPLRSLGKRLVILRTGIVLAREGGALPAFRAPLKAGIGAILGDGKQMISWIHLEDLCRLYVQAIEDPSLEGIYNAVSPQPVANKTLVLCLAQQLRGRFFIAVHVPAFLLKIALGEMSVEVLKSCTVDAQKARDRGFRFTFPSLEAALKNLSNSGD
jgi:uncharacterized protein